MHPQQVDYILREHKARKEAIERKKREEEERKMR
jgi:hypothetical protein